ncbi:MAG: hypothetical protein OXC61_07035 [Flavobacteriaceae bacterium]|nr:hypothetical protein [Flavobacteriaceae bacterium]
MIWPCIVAVSGMGQNQLISELIDDLTNSQFEKAYQKWDQTV